MTKILLVEDRQQHLADAKALLEERMRTGAITEVGYVSTLDQAIKSLRAEKYDGIISDVFFPVDEEGVIAASGTSVAEYALVKSIPVVLITSTFHHGKKTQPVCEWTRERYIKLIDRFKHAEAHYTKDWEATTKDWKSAYLTLAYLIEGKRSGEVTINLDGIFLKGHPMNRPVLHPDRRPEISPEILFGRDPLLKTTIEKYCEGMSFKEKYEKI